MTAEPVVALRGFSLSRRRGGDEIPILADIDLDLAPGSWTALVGANGAGKSSLLRYLASEDSPVADRTAIVFQDPDEQLVAASVDAELTLGRRDADAAALRAAFGLAEAGAVPPRLLSAGQKQRLALAVALGQQPRVLLCDEPTALQDADQTAWVLDRLDRWRRETGGVLVTATCDRREAARADALVVLEAGRIAWSGPPEAGLASPPVRELLAPLPAAPVAAASGETVLEADAVTVRFAGDGPVLGPFSLRADAGERVGLVGPSGCGKSTLLTVCSGLLRPAAGRVRAAGRRLYAGSGRDLDHGRVLLAPQFPEYLFATGSVRDEIGLDPRLAALDPARLGLPPDLLDRDPHALSAGQRRRLALGLVIASARPVLLLDEPAAALDRAGRRRVLALLDEVPRTSAVVIASHDHEFLAAAGCRRVDLSART